jgi:hypothetical protein
VERSLRRPTVHACRNQVQLRGRSRNTREVYELAQVHAGKDVSAVPIFLSSDATLLTKKLGGHPIIYES